jgi:hypothetical protein
MTAAKLEAKKELEYAKQDLEDKKHRRKWLEARLYAGNMTTSQFSEYKGYLNDMDLVQKKLMTEEMEAENKLEAQEEFRNMEEMLESHRRDMVAQGKWSEEDSYNILRSELQQIEKINERELN